MDALKLTENTLKKAGVGGTYYAVEPYGGANTHEQAEKDEELKKLRTKVASLQQQLDIANRRPSGAATVTSYRQKDKPWNLVTGTEKVAITCRDW